MSTPLQNMNDELLVKYLLGEASAEEAMQVAQWIEADAANKRYFGHFRLIWDESKKLASKSTVSEDEAWERFRQRTQSKIKAPTVIEMPRRQISWMRVAAILVMLVGGGWSAWYFANTGSNQMISLNSYDAVLIDTLPDGSVVTLNKESSISYPKNFKGDTRKISLQGEAFFNVTPDKSKPFVITVNDVTVSVVGTSFNVKNTDKETEVIVETGIVEVAKEEHAVRLNPNEKATVSKADDAPHKEENEDALYNYYRTKEFVCNGTPLWRLVDVLNEAYKVNITIGNERIKNLALTTTFRNQSLDDVLVVVSETLNVRVERNGTNITIK